MYIKGHVRAVVSSLCLGVRGPSALFVGGSFSFDLRAMSSKKYIIYSWLPHLQTFAGIYEGISIYNIACICVYIIWEFALYVMWTRVFLRQGRRHVSQDEDEDDAAVCLCAPCARFDIYTRHIYLSIPSRALMLSGLDVLYVVCCCICVCWFLVRGRIAKRASRTYARLRVACT